MSKYLAGIAERVINQPLMILPEKLAVIALVLEGRINLDASDFALEQEVTVTVGDQTVDAPKPDASRYVGEFRLLDPKNPRAGYKPYRMTPEGAAIIPVHGSLVNRGGFLDAMSGITSYEKLRHQVNAARSDDDVIGTLLHMDTPGGEAVGAFETGDVVAKHAQTKPIYAISDGMCCSAGYAIACGATKVIVSRSSLSGSIGTALLHLDRSKQIAEMGVKPTLFVTGKRKADGSPFFPLSEEVKGELRDYVQRVNQNFLNLVSSNRGRHGVTNEKLLALEAGVFIGGEAIAHGLVDEVGTFEGALSELHSLKMSTRKGLPLMDKTFSQAELDAATATARAEGHKAGLTEGTAAGTTAGVAAERARFKAVQTSEDYVGRESSANHILHNTSMSAEDIKGVLKGIAPAQQTKAAPQGERAQDQPGGLVVEGAQSSTNPNAPQQLSEFDQGKKIAAGLPAAMRKTA